MSSLLRILEPELTTAMARAGFVRTDKTPPVYEEHAEVVQLEYVGVTSDRRRFLLDVCHVTARQTVSATHWAPEDLKRADCSAPIESVAHNYLIWRSDPAVDLHDLAHEIVQVVKGWFEPVPVKDADRNPPSAGAGR